MKAMILAAGRGERMRPLTDVCPKPLLAVGGKPLLVWHIERLAQAGVKELVINHAWLGEKIEAYLGSGSSFGVDIVYSREGQALETAGGIATALPFLGNEPFLVVNGDVYCDIDFQTVLPYVDQLKNQDFLAWLMLVRNPLHHLQGDFALSDGLLIEGDANQPRHTYSGIGLYNKEMFRDVLPCQASKLAPLLYNAIAMRKICGMLFEGRWEDVGTPERLQLLDDELSSRAK